MPCEVLPLAGGGNAIVCSSGRAKRCACGGRAPFLCDWKVSTRRSGTCDAPICVNCATTPAPEKHLCPEHSTAFRARRNARSAGARRL